MCVYIYLCVYVYIYKYIYIFINIYIYKYKIFSYQVHLVDIVCLGLKRNDSRYLQPFFIK